MIADIQRLENAARMSLGTFCENEPASSGRFVPQAMLAAVFAVLSLPCIAAAFLYY